MSCITPESAAAGSLRLSPEVLAVIADHGLTAEEYQHILEGLSRAPNLVELGIFSVMWSEHCSYKSSRFHLKKLPVRAPWVICGPGENAGVIDIGDGQAAVFKMESHNHPSYIEPREGAATGVGGILRDIFTMGARPIANLNALRFGRPEHPRMRHLLSGVVRGIGDYGNCVGVPTVGGEVNFHSAYDGNILVNAMTVGIADRGRIFYSAASGIGNSLIYVGSKTGRDGIHGAVMASSDFDEDSVDKRPTVQIGDPFTEKLLLEACLELMELDAIVAIQDMGAAGLTSSSVEMASKGGVGAHLFLDDVPQREVNMTASDIMLSESQERMLMVLEPEREAEARAIFDKWELDFAVIGRIIAEPRLILEHCGTIVCDIPLLPLVEEAPLYDRPHSRSPTPTPLVDVPECVDIAADLTLLMGSADLASRRWIWEQYDSQVGSDTIQKPGGDAAVVRIHGSNKALAMTTDCTPRYCFADPYEGGKQAVAEAYRNVSAVGAKPLAVTNCLNFANPQRAEIMGQLVGCIEGIAEACTALDFPVVSGNVSLYNESRTDSRSTATESTQKSTQSARGSGSAILPTPAIGGVGLLEDWNKSARIAFRRTGDIVLAIGERGGHLGQSLWLREVHGREEGPPPPVDLKAERRTATFIRSSISQGWITACHDVSDGGLAVALAEMALASNIGVLVNEEQPFGIAGSFFGEDQGLYLVTVCDTYLADFLDEASKADVPVDPVGRTIRSRIIFELPRGDFTVDLDALREVHEGFFPALMES